MRRKIVVYPISLEKMRQIIRSGAFVSIWGHEDTIAQASSVLGADVTPLNARQAILLDDEHFPVVGNERFTQVLVLSPELPRGLRPEADTTISAEEIIHWFPLLLDFNAIDNCEAL